MSDSLDPSHWLLGIAPTEQPPDHYRLLGIERLELNSDVIANAAQRQLDHLKRCSSGGDRQRANFPCQEVIRARDCLLDPESHRFYAAQLQGVDSEPTDLATKADWRAFVAEFDQAWRAAQTLKFDPQHHWLGIPLHQRPASNLRLLGLSDRERSADVIRGAAERQISFVRKFASGEQSEAANDLLRQLSRARAALLRSIRPDEKDHAEVQANSQASVPVPRGPVFDRAPPVVEPDLADLDAPDWEVPVAIVPPPSVPVVAVETRQQPNWMGALVASAVMVLTLAGAGYISYSRSSIHRATQVAEATGQIKAAREQPSAGADPADQHGPSRYPAARQQTHGGDRALIDLDNLKPAESAAETESESSEVIGISGRHAESETAIANGQMVTALQQLSAFENQMQELQSRIDQKATVTEDHQKVFSLIEKLGKFGTDFSQVDSAVDKRAEKLRARATQLLERMDYSPSGQAGLESASMDRPEPEPTHVVQPESMDHPTRSSAGDLNPTDQRPVFFSRPRDWTWDRTSDRAGSFSAIVVQVDEDRVVFKSPQNGSQATLSLDELIPADAKLLRLAFFGDQENQQFEQTRTYVSRIGSTPLASAESLKASHRASRTGPYAGLWASVCMSTGKNRHTEAASIIRQVISKIELQRQVDPNRHAMTLTSALNNLAVCTIKDHQVDRAAGYFVESLETMPAPSAIVLHNARQLKELSSLPGTPLTLRSSSRRNLDQALIQHPMNSESLPSGWHYSLDVDLPRYDDGSSTGGKRYLSQDSGMVGGPSSLRVKDTWCINCKGLGSVPCKYGKCNNGTIVVQRQVQVAVNPLNGEPVYGNKGFKQSCPSCSGRGRFDCQHCEGGRL